MPYTYPDVYRAMPTAPTTRTEDLFAGTVSGCASLELQQRVLTWLKGVPPFEEYHDFVPVATRARTTRISSKPYARPEGSKPLARRVSNIPAPEITSPVTDLSLCQNTCLPYGEVPAGILHTLKHNPVQYRIPPSKLSRGLDDLPERGHNPLVTQSPDELREEYRRIVSLYNTLEEKRQQIEGAWRLRGMPPVAMDEVVAISTSLRRLVDSAQYIVDFASEWGIEVDFYQVFSRYRCPPLRQCMPVASMPQQMMYMGPDDSMRRQSVM